MNDIFSKRKEEYFEWYLTQVQAFIQSPAIKQFLVGITKNEKKRLTNYKKEKFKYFIILATNLSLKDAVKFEEALFNKFRKDNK